jgi:hypothetical protein
MEYPQGRAHPLLAALGNTALDQPQLSEKDLLTLQVLRTALTEEKDPASAAGLFQKVQKESAKYVIAAAELLYGDTATGDAEIRQTKYIGTYGKTLAGVAQLASDLKQMSDHEIQKQIWRPAIQQFVTNYRGTEASFGFQPYGSGASVLSTGRRKTGEGLLSGSSSSSAPKG